MRFEVYQQRSLSSLAIGGQWRWRLRAGNGEIIAQGEGYTTRQNCLHAISLIKSTTATTPVIDGDTGAQLTA